VAALQEMTAVTSSVLRDGRLVRIPSDQLVRGDLLVLGEGDAVGADGRLTEAAALRVLEASLTGESEAVEKNVSALPGPTALGDRRCMVFKGTAVAQGAGSLPPPGWRRKWVPSPTCWRRPRRSPHHCRPRWVGSGGCWASRSSSSLWSSW
jgi:E1-E2 ATPase